MMKTYLVPVTIADDRLVEVEAKDPADAKERVRAGRYKRLGKTLERGFLVIGQPVEKI